MLRTLRSIIISITMIVLFSTPFIAYAKKITYTANYDAPTFKVQGRPSLKGATLQVQLYINGKSIGKFTKRTNQVQSFIIDNRYGNLLVVEVVSVKGEPQGISCHGTSLAGKSNIIINCHPRYGKGHYY